MAGERTQILDLDNLFEARFFIKLDQAEHDLQPLSVEDFIANTLEMQELDANKGLAGEVGLICKMLARSFPTISADRFRKLPLVALYKLLDTAQARNGSGSGNKEAAPTNPPPAAADASAA